VVKEVAIKRRIFILGMPKKEGVERKPFKTPLMEVLPFIIYKIKFF
jgi:hypothetical protein